MKFKKGLIFVLFCAFFLCSCGGEKEETTTTVQSVKFETTTTTEAAEAEPEPSESSESSGGMVILDELEIGEGADGVIDFGE